MKKAFKGKYLFIAFPTRQYSGQSDINSVTFRVNNLSDARHWVINHLDCSYQWDIKAPDNI